MKIITSLKIAIVSLIILVSGCNQPTNTQGEYTAQAEQEDEAKVKEVLQAYKSGIEALSVEGLEDLFMKDSEVFESGGVEGSFDHYLGHHLAPELKAFESFQFSDHKVTAKIDLPYAFATETYNYKIVLASDGRIISQKGVGTSILKKVDGKWKILKTHTSARAKQSDESGH